MWKCVGNCHGDPGGTRGHCFEDDCDFMAHHAEAGRVKACPVCGTVVLFNCWHPRTEEVCSVWMPEGAASTLAEEYEVDPWAQYL